MPIPYTPPYAATGPWTNGAAPGISASALNEIEGWILSVDQPTASTINGSTSGTASIWQPLTGTWKLVIVQTVNFRNGSAPAQTLALPTPFTSIVILGKNSNLNPFQVLKSGTAQTVQQLQALGAAGAANTVSPQTTIQANWIWHCDTGIDTVSFPGSQSSAAGGHLIMFGI